VSLIKKKKKKTFYFFRIFQLLISKEKLLLDYSLINYCNLKILIININIKLIIHNFLITIMLLVILIIIILEEKGKDYFND